jgi:predicted RNase H-like HicB family nuclease
MAKSKTYEVVYEYDGARWFVRVAEIAGCHAQGRTLAQARKRIREALGLFDPSAHRATLVDEIKLPGPVLTELKRVRAAKERAKVLSREISASNRRLAKELTGAVGVGLSDAGELLGCTKQRLYQLLKGA